MALSFRPLGQHIRRRCSLEHPYLHSLRRRMGTGSRGARGHGWYVNYRSGEGGRHLQGEYSDRPPLEEQKRWNQAIIGLGSKRVTLNVVVLPKGSSSDPTTLKNSKKVPYTPPDLDAIDEETVIPLEIDLASTVLPQTTSNYIDILERLVGSRFYRFEKGVGICGGDFLTNTGRNGQASKGQFIDINDPLVMWNIPGTISMIVPTVGTVDSRFMLLSQPAPHMDGIHRAFGQMTTESLENVTQWQSELLTSYGVPISYDLVIYSVLADEKEKASSEPSEAA